MPIEKFRPNTLQVDVPPSEQPKDSVSGENVQFRNGFCSRTQGWSQYGADCPGEPQWLLNAPHGGVNYWIVGADDGIYIFDGSTWTDLTPAVFNAPDEPNSYTGGLLNGVPVINLTCVAGNVPWYVDFNDLTTVKDLPGWLPNTTVAWLRPFKFHLVAGDVTESSVNVPDKVIWSTASQPGTVPTTWVPASDNSAGDNQIGDSDSPVIDMALLRGQAILLKSRSMYSMGFTGGTFVFSFRQLFTSVGVLARNCFAEHLGKLYVLSDGDAIVTDGQNVTSLWWGRAQTTVFRQIDPVAFKYSFVALNKPNSEIIFAVPETGEDLPNVALTYAVNTDSIGARYIDPTAHMSHGVVSLSYDDTWATGGEAPDEWDDGADLAWVQSRFNAADDGILMALPGESALYELDAGFTNAAGETVVMTLTKREFDHGDAQLYKLVTRVWPRITADMGSNVQVRVGGQANEGGQINWSNAANFSPENDEFVDLFAEGRFLTYEFIVSGGDRFQLEGFDVELNPRGYY